MPRYDKSMSRGVAFHAVGAAVGASARYAMVCACDTRGLLLVVTLASVTIAFVVIGAVATSPLGDPARKALVGCCGAIASLSAYSVLGVTQMPWLAAGLLILTPVSAVAGLTLGTYFGSMVSRWAGNPGSVETRVAEDD
jgi:CrcB protein